mgnify:CR=1 FL=1
MRRTKLLKFIRDYQRPYYCLIENKYFDKRSRSYVYHLQFEVTRTGVRCFDWANNHRVIAYAQDDSDIDRFTTQIETVTDRIDGLILYVFFATKKDALVYIGNPDNGFDKQRVKSLKRNLKEL